MNDFYVYAWQRPCGTPFYIGKGRGRRAFVGKRQNPLFMRIVDKLRTNGKDPKVVKLHQNLTEHRAFELERAEIAKYGRRDNGTGILANLTDGGEGCAGIGEETLGRFADTCLSRPSAGGNYKGVRKTGRNWSASIRFHATTKYLGAYRTAVEAARAYDIAAYGASKQAYLNFPESVHEEPPAPIGKIGAILERALFSPPSAGEYKGVQRHGSRWRARITVDGERLQLGTFNTAEDAAIAYDKAAVSVDSNAYLNFPDRAGDAAPVPCDDGASRAARMRGPRGVPYKGVRLHNGGPKWIAAIKRDGRRCPIGIFDDPKDAAYAYDRAAVDLYGVNNCYLNFPEEHIA